MAERARRSQSNNAASPLPWPALIAGSLVAVPAVLPLAVGFLPELYLTSDPRLSDSALVTTHFGPAGAVVWHLLAVVGAVLALAFYVQRGGRLRWTWLALAGLGIAAAFWHGTRHSDNLLPAGSWTAGAALAVAAAHVGRLPSARRWMAGVVIAMMVPVGLQAGYDVLVQKPRDLAWWKANEMTLLEQQGIRPGSSQHQLMERRTASIDATGPFGFSNALGTLAAGGAVLGLCASLGFGFREEQRLAWAGPACAVAGACGLAAVWFTHSTGALGAIVIAAGVLALVWLLGRGRWRRGLPVLALLAVALPIVVVLLRGAGGPPASAEGERSLLFRYHYWQAAARVVQDDLPQSALTGVGLAGYKYGYLAHKNPLSPENVDSAHNVFVDWVTMLGLGGAAWCVLVLCWLWVAARAGARQDTEADRARAGHVQTDKLLHRPPVIAALLVAGAVFVTQYLLQYAMMDAALALLWLVGAAGFVVVLALIGQSPRLGGRGLTLGLLGMATAVLVQSQIDMAFKLMATAVPAWFLLGLAAAAEGGEPDAPVSPVRFRRSAYVLAGGGLLSAVLVVCVVVPVVRHQRLLAGASLALATDQPYRALAELEAAAKAQPSDSTAARWVAIVRRDEMLMLADAGRPDAAREAYRLAMAPLDAQIKQGYATSATYRLRASLMLQAADALGDEALREEAAVSYEALLVLSPYNLPDTVALADLYADLGQDAKALQHYRRALELDALAYLDPAVQLDDETRQRIDAAVRRLGPEEPPG
jgi:tetratricopeptide (TPR) repeat protein